jgi:hypothetical protein
MATLKDEKIAQVEVALTEQGAHNGQFQSTCYHLSLFNRLLRTSRAGCNADFKKSLNRRFR